MVENLKLFTVDEASKILKVSTRQVWRYVDSGKLKVIRISYKIIRVAEKDLKDFIKKHKTK